MTDYDKALIDAYNKDSGRYAAECLTHKCDIPQMYADAFFQGYEYGKKSQNIANCDIDHFRDTTKMMRYEIAKAAMQGLMANTKVYDGAKNSPRYAEHTIPEVIVMESIALADALIKELGKEEE